MLILCLCYAFECIFIRYSEEAILCYFIEFLVWTENDVWEVGMIDAIGPVLCFEAHGVLDIIHLSALSFVLLDPVAGIDLESFHGCPALHGSSVGLQGGCMAQLFGCIAVAEAPVVVNTSAGCEERVVNTVADTCGLAEIHRTSFYGRYLARRASGFVKGRVSVCKHLQDMVVYFSASFACEVEIGMVGHGNECRRIGLRFVVNAERVVFGRGIGYPYVEVAGIVLFAIFGAIVQFDFK